MPGFQLLIVALLVVLGLPARSQPITASPSVATRAATTPTAADAQAAIPKLNYRSPFAAYQADRAEEPRSWREVNDRVGAIGGWRAYAREAQTATPTPPAAVPQAPTPPRN
jgi:hypothetical protein